MIGTMGHKTGLQPPSANQPLETMNAIHPQTLPAPLPKTDWNFDPVPDAEIVACCWWEYARESAFIRALRQRSWDASKPPSAPGGGLSLEAECRLHLDLETAQTIGGASDVFLSGISFPPAAAPLAEGDLREVTGSFPQPWQTLTAAERTHRSRLATEGKRFPLVAFQPGSGGQAQILFDHTKTPAAQADAGPVRQESTVLIFDWSACTNAELVRCFRRWVNENRPLHQTVPSQKGHKLVDWRTNLTRLAVLRLLARFTVRQLVAENAFPEIWQAQQFTGRKWEDVTKWHNARREAGNVFQKLFPFLPPNELPLAWQRHYPANTTVFPG